MDIDKLTQKAVPKGTAFVYYISSRNIVISMLLNHRYTTRSKVLAEGIDTVDIDRLLKRILK